MHRYHIVHVHSVDYLCRPDPAFILRHIQRVDRNVSIRVPAQPASDYIDIMHFRPPIHYIHAVHDERVVQGAAGRHAFEQARFTVRVW